MVKQIRIENRICRLMALYPPHYPCSLYQMMWPNYNVWIKTLTNAVDGSSQKQAQGCLFPTHEPWLFLSTHRPIYMHFQRNTCIYIYRRFYQNTTPGRDFLLSGIVDLLSWHLKVLVYSWWSLFSDNNVYLFISCKDTTFLSTIQIFQIFSSSHPFLSPAAIKN